MSAHLQPDTSAPRAASSLRCRRAVGVTLFSALALSVAGCASFADSGPTFSPAPTLTPNVATVIPPDDAQAGAATLPVAPDDGGGGGAPSRTPTTAADPCAPPELPVVAVCLDAPWGLAPLPSGDTALVGERTSGRILSVRAGQQPELVATVTGLDTSRGGGLLGLALSPYYVEDGLIYAYVTTPADARVVRLAAGQQPKPVVTGLPVGGSAMGGSLIFDEDGLLYVAVGSADGGAAPSDTASGGHDPDATLPGGAAPSTAPAATSAGPPGTTSSATTPSVTTSPHSSAPAPRATPSTAPQTGTAPGPVPVAAAVYRVDTFGHPAPGNSSGTSLFADGLTDPTGMCLLPDGTVGTVDHRTAGDVLIALADGGDYRSPAAGDAVWTYSAGDGGAVDCAVAGGELTATGRIKPRATTLEFGTTGRFTGSPTAVLDGTYGMLRTAEPGPGELTWITTANTRADGPAGAGAGPSDDRVIVLPPSSAGGGGGGLD